MARAKLGVRAWAVSDDDEIFHLVHAASRSEAKAQWWAEREDFDIEWVQVTARRAPKFDGILHPTDRQWLDRGYWVHCAEVFCGGEIYPGQFSDPTYQRVWDQQDRAYCAVACWQRVRAARRLWSGR